MTSTEIKLRPPCRAVTVSQTAVKTLSTKQRQVSAITAQYHQPWKRTWMIRHRRPTLTRRRTEDTMLAMDIVLITSWKVGFDTHLLKTRDLSMILLGDIGPFFVNCVQRIHHGA